MTETPPTVWHYWPDAMPRLEGPRGGPLQLKVPVGMIPSPTAPATVQVEWKTRESDTAVWVDRPAELAKNWTLSDVQAMQEHEQNEPAQHNARVPSRPYSFVILRGTNAYYEATLAGIDPGSQVQYSVQVAVPGAASATLGPFRVTAVVPEFDSTDRRGGRAGTFTAPEPVWIGHLQQADGWTHVRIDLDDIDTTPGAPIPVRVLVGGVWYTADPPTVAATRGESLLPLVDPFTDTVTFSIRSDDPDVVVEVYGRRVDTIDWQPSGTTRVMLNHFAIQALNDLLETPFTGYLPPRTYIQVTMRDEDGIYSSKPSAQELSRDGYSFGFDMHRRFGVPYQLALNGGILHLMAHDCPDSGMPWLDGLQSIREDISKITLYGAPLISPILAGYGAFRMLYYQAETMKREVAFGEDIQRSLLFGGVLPHNRARVFYLDSRIYTETAKALPALSDGNIDYLVLDSDTGYYDNEDSATLNRRHQSIDAGPNFVWRDKGTNKKLLFIDDLLKNSACGPEMYWQLGKPDLALRRRLMRFALDPRLAGNLLIYGDDFEKACNNGWFEGASGLKEAFSAFLEWLSAHQTWLRFTTVHELTDGDVVGSIQVKTSTDPVIDPGGARSVDLQKRRMHFDSWRHEWRKYPADWIGGTLGQITDKVEDALVHWPGPENDLVRTAWLSFLMHQHESFWSKQFLDDPVNYNPNRTAVGKPEDFTIVEGLQVRNTLVWLKASVWAQWAASHGGAATTYVNEGPLRRELAALATTAGLPPEATDLRHFDADPLETYVLYNSEALVVVDRCGGVVSHAFVLRNGKPHTVSGTYKSYQYRSFAHGDPRGTECDGMVLQNTVRTPNHAYIGSERGLQVGPVVVQEPDVRGPHRNVYPRLLPNNFDAYEPADAPAGVTMSYGPGGQPVPEQVGLNEYAALLRRDGKARRTGKKGDEIVWHTSDSFRKTFTLQGSRLTVRYDTPLPANVCVDNEFCVDLYAGAMRNALLQRAVATDQRSITVSNTEGSAVQLTIDDGGAFTPASLCTGRDDADSQGLLSEFLTLSRVLTEAARIVPDPQLPLRYTIELNA